MEKIRFYIKKYWRLAIQFWDEHSHIIKSKKAKTLVSRVPGNQTAQSLVRRYKLFFSIACVIIVSLVLTGFSLLLYVVTGTSKLDLSRPGYEGVRNKVVRTPLRENAFEPNGALDKKIVNDYLEKYKKQSQTLSKYDTFDPRLLDDAPLGLGAGQVAPSDGATTPSD